MKNKQKKNLSKVDEKTLIYAVLHGAEFSPLGAPYQLKLGHQSALTGAANAALFFLFITARMNMLE